MTATTTAEVGAVLELEPVNRAPAPALIQNHQLPAVAVTPADLLRIAMDSGDKDIERLERLMVMDERYRESQERERQRAAVLAFRRDFAALRGENIIIPKSKHVDRGKAGSFNQAEYDQVCERLSPAMSKHGFSFRHDQKFGSRKWVTDGVENDEAWVYVTCYLEHREGHFEKLDLEGPPGDLHANTPVQNMQATASFLKRQSLLAITGTATGGEDDENKLRGKAGKEGPPVGNASEFDRHLDAGRAASLNGAQALRTWWGEQTGAVRELLMGEFKSLKDAATKADRERQQ